MTLIVCGQMMKEMTRECLHPITKILLIEEIIIVEVMQEMDLLKGMDQPQDELQMVQCEGIIFECSQVVTNVSASGLLSQRTRNVCKAFLINMRMLLCILQNCYQTMNHKRKDLKNVMSVT